MYIKQSILLKDMDREFISQFMGITRKETFGENKIFFEEGEPATKAFMLIEGIVRLSVGSGGQVVYTVNRAGEIFGWSTLMGRDNYSATARSRSEGILLAMDRDRLEHILAENPLQGLVFYRRIARMLGDRLIKSYQVMGSGSQVGMAATEGSSVTAEYAAPA